MLANYTFNHWHFTLFSAMGAGFLAHTSENNVEII